MPPSCRRECLPQAEARSATAFSMLACSGSAARRLVYRQVAEQRGACFLGQAYSKWRYAGITEAFARGGAVMGWGSVHAMPMRVIAVDGSARYSESRRR